MLQDAETNWQFDIFGFAAATPGTTLALLTFHFYKVSGCIQHFSIDSGKLFTYLQKIESGYVMENPYHNRSVCVSVCVCVCVCVSQSMTQCVVNLVVTHPWGMQTGCLAGSAPRSGLAQACRFCQSCLYTCGVVANGLVTVQYKRPQDRPPKKMLFGQI